MSLELYHKGQKVIFESSGFSLDDVLYSRSPFDVTIQDPQGTMSVHKGDNVELFLDGTKIWGGFVDRVSKKIISSRSSFRRFVCELVDYQSLADNRTIAKKYNEPGGQTCGSIVKNIVSSVLVNEGVRCGDFLLTENTKAQWDAGTLDTGLSTSDSGLTLSKAANINHVDTLTADFSGSLGSYLSNAGDHVTLLKKGADFSHTDTLTADFNAGTLVNVSSAGDQLILPLNGTSFSKVYTVNADFNAGSFSQTDDTQVSNQVQISLAGLTPWYDVYNWRKTCPIGGSADGTQTSYPLLFVVINTSGTDSGNVKYTGGNCLNFPYDIRITNSSGTSLALALEYTTGNTAYVWALADSIPTGGTTFYMFYGKSGDTGIYNNSGVFTFWDGFDSLSSNWTNWGSPTKSVAGSVLTISQSSGANGIYWSAESWGQGYATIIRKYANSTNAEYITGCSVGTDAGNFVGEHGVYISDSITARNAGGGTNYDTAWLGANYKTAYHRYEAKRKTSGGDDFGIDWSTSYTNNSSGVVTTAMNPMIVPWGGSCTLYVDYIFVRKITNNEPVVNTTMSTVPRWFTSGTWQSQSLSIASAGVAASSSISWTAGGTGTITVTTSIDGGSTWQSATSGQPINGITDGFNCSGKTVILKVAFSGNGTSTPLLYDITITVTPQRYTSGSWTSAAWALDTVVMSRTSVLSWTATIPAGAITVDVSVDNGVTWATNVTNGAAIAAFALGTSTIGKLLRVRANFTGTTSTSPTLSDITFSVTTSYYTSGVYVSGALDISSVGYMSTALISWTCSPGSVTMETSIDGGATWQAASSGGAINGLTYQSVSGVAVKYRATFASDGSMTPSLNDVTVIVTAGYPKSAIRYTPPIDLTGVGVVGDNSITYAATTPANTSVLIETSLDGVTWHDLSAGVNGLNKLDYCIGKILHVRQTLASTDGVSTPTLTNVTISVNNGSICDGPIIPEAAFGRTKCSTAFQRLADFSGYWWCIDRNLVLWFQPPGNLTSALDSVTDMDPLVGSEITVTEEAQDYRNTQYIKGGVEITGLQTQQLKCDGVTRAWNLRYKVNQEPTVTVNGVTKTVGIQGLDNGKNFYWNKGDYTLSQESTDTVLTTETLSVNYVGQFPLTAKITDDAEIAANAARMGGSFMGVVEAVEDNSNINGSINAFQYGGGLLKTYAKIGTTVEYDTYRAGYYPGENVVVDLPEYGIDYQSMLIVSTTMTLDGSYIKYHVKLVDDAAYSDWAMFYQKLVDRSDSIVEDVSDDGVIATSQNFNEIATATETITTETGTVYKWSSTLYVGENVYPG